MSKKIGFIGLGVMGTSMAKNLMKSGHQLFVYNRNANKAEALAKEGAIVCLTPEEMAKHVDCICLCVTNGQVVKDLLFSEQGVCKSLVKPKFIIDFSTISPEEATDIAKSLKEEGILFYDAPVTGGDVGAKNATLTIMVGGEERYLTELEDILSAVGKKILHVGESGKGQLTKCVNQIAVALGIAAMTEALVFAESSGLDINKTLEIIGSGAGGSWAINNYAPRIIAGDLKPGFHAANMLKDLKISLAEADKMEVSLPITDLVKQFYVGLLNCVKRDGNDINDFGNHALIEFYNHSLKP